MKSEKYRDDEQILLKSDTKILLVLIVCFGAVALSAIIYGLSNLPPSQVETFVGRLDSIEYEQEGWLHSVSATILHFENHTDFKQSGYFQYAIGFEYKVTYKVTEVYKNPSRTDVLLEVLNVERYDEQH